MTLPPLSPGQRRAVEHPLVDALVTAGAGSGKTRVLTERFAHLVRTEAVALRRLAALTFTEKAAAQMRSRIAQLFRQLGDEALRADVEFAPISTLHSFCALLLRQHAVEAGVDPSFQVLDAGEAALLREDAAALAENRILVERPGLVGLFPSLAGNGREELLSLLERLRGAGRRPDEIEWMDGGTSSGDAADVVRLALEDYTPVGPLLPDDLQWAHGDLLARVAAVLAQVQAGAGDTAPFTCAQARMAAGALRGRHKPAYSKARKALEDGLAGLEAALLDRWGGRVLVPAMREVLGTYEAAYAELKHERSALDFTDLELRARDLLRHATSVGRPLDLAPHALLVDEYQDTNPLQAEILQMLRARAPQFSVGDPKQSIYRFRRADVQVILAERERVGAADCHAMNTSYRACPLLVQGINAISARLFEGGRAGVAYEPLEAAGTFLPPSGPVLEFALLDAGSAGNADLGREAEARWIAQRIEELSDGTRPRLLPKRDEAGRPSGVSVGSITRGDIAILFRAGTSLTIYEAALQARGIPYLTQRSTGFFQADEITDLVHVLRAVHNPEDRYALACTAAGPALAAGDDDLLRWFSPALGEGAASAWDRMQAEAAAGGSYTEAIRSLRRLRTEAVGGSLARAVECVLHDLGLYEMALLRPAGDRRAANLRKAVDLARRLDQGGRRGLADLLRHLAILRDRAVGEAEAPVGGEADDVVRLTTVHGAKGLEYPVVFVADVGRGRGGQRPNILYDGGTHVAAKVSDPLEGVGCRPAGYDRIAAQEAAEEAQEEQRLLYVAMTRAEERLVLSGWCKGARKDGRPSYFLGWGSGLWGVLNAPFEHGVHEVALTGADARMRVHVIDAETVEAPTLAEAPAPSPAADEEAGREAERLWREATAAVAPLGDTRYVVSVSDLLAFADSPQRYYRERVVLAGVRAAQTAAWDAPPADAAAHLPGVADTGSRRAERSEDWDEAAEEAPADRAAIGRAVHAVIEKLGPRDASVPDSILAAAVLAEGGDEAFAQVVCGMTQRFIRSPIGGRLREALAGGQEVRREVALHARIRFPGGDEVAGFDSLLVKGSIDLWLPSPEGVLIVDHKTNMAGGRFRSPADLADHYAWQLRLYALAAERVLGADVAGARLLMLDPGWGPDAVEVAVDVSGPHLEETRRLCRALAVAEHEGRYPEDWRMLLPERTSGR